MSDRQGSVRTQDTAARSGDPAPASATQAIPTTGAQKAQTGAASAGGSSATGAAPAAPASGAVASGAGASGAGASGAAASTAASSPAKKAPGRGGRPAKAAGRGPRRARLQLRHVDIWSAFKVALVLSIALFFIWMVAVGILYGVLSGLGVFNALNDLFGQFASASGNNNGGGQVITPGIVFGGAAVIGAINVVLMTALCTVGTFLYNLCADLVGGLEVTLSERD